MTGQMSRSRRTRSTGAARIAANSVVSAGAGPAGAGLRKSGTCPEGGINSVSRPRAAPAAAIRGRTWSTQIRCTGCVAAEFSSRKPGAISHIGETANRICARSLAENASSSRATTPRIRTCLNQNGEAFAADAAPGDRGRAISVLRRAVELGVNHIDTAAFCFSSLRSANELINRALAPYPDGLVITTKVGPGRNPSGEWLPHATPKQLRGQVEENLRQLGRDHLDVVNLRIVGTDSIAERFGALAELREAGLIRHLGCPTSAPTTSPRLRPEGVSSGSRPWRVDPAVTEERPRKRPVARTCSPVPRAVGQGVRALARQHSWPMGPARVTNSAARSSGSSVAGRAALTLSICRSRAARI